LIWGGWQLPPQFSPHACPGDALNQHIFAVADIGDGNRRPRRWQIFIDQIVADCHRFIFNLLFGGWAEAVFDRDVKFATDKAASLALAADQISIFRMQNEQIGRYRCHTAPPF